MINGLVTDHLDAIVPLRVRSGSIGVGRDIEAVLDTGFNDFLTLPAELITELDLPQVGKGKLKQSDGKEIDTDLYMAYVFWQGQEKLIPVQAGGEVLVGMRLLYENLVTLQVRFGGRVTVEPLA